MNMKPSPLRHLDLSDDAVSADMAAEKARQLIDAYERIQYLQDAIRGLLDLITAVSHHFSPAISSALATNPCVLDARELVQ
jgi:hypothetical protein